MTEGRNAFQAKDAVALPDSWFFSSSFFYKCTVTGVIYTLQQLSHLLHFLSQQHNNYARYVRIFWLLLVTVRIRYAVLSLKIGALFNKPL